MKTLGFIFVFWVVAGSGFPLRETIPAAVGSAEAKAAWPAKDSRAEQVPGAVTLVRYDELEARLGRKSDTTYLVNFWATWCGPCIQELPYFDRLQETYGSEKLKVLLVSLDFKSQLEKGVIPFVKKHAVQSEVLLLNEPDQASVINRVSSDWSGALPATLVVNGATGKRAFHEGTFTYDELEEFYLLTQK